MTASVWFIIIALLSITRSSCSTKDPYRELWSSSSGRSEEPILVGGNEIVPESDLRNPNRRIWIVTTACLPWLTGTSVNPLLRAAHLAKDRPKGRITLLVPWLPLDEQDIAYPPGVRFNSPDEQREYVKKWLIEDAQLPVGAERLEISFYTARYQRIPHHHFDPSHATSLILPVHLSLYEKLSIISLTSKSIQYNCIHST